MEQHCSVLVAARMFLVALCALAAHEPLYSRDMPGELLDRAKQATVYIEVTHKFSLNGQEVPTTGIGYFISSHGYVVTSYHVVQPVIHLYEIGFPAPVKKIRIIRNSGKPDHEATEARILAVDIDNDLAILATKARPSAVFSPASAPALHETYPVWIMGFPFSDAFSVIQRGPEITVSKGSISSLRHDDRGTLNSIQIDASINPGNSGGPVIDADGNVLGVVKHILGTSPVTIAVPVHYLIALVKKFSIDAPFSDTASLELEIQPDSSAFFIDWKQENTFPASPRTIASGWRTLYAGHEGFEPWVQRLTCTGNVSRNVTLVPCRSLPVIQAPLRRTAPADSGTDAKFFDSGADKGRRLINETFDEPGVLKNWEQSTGGTDKRTWFIEEGALHQYDSDRILHAVYLGDSTWRDYAVSVRLRISDLHDDSRAGLIVRENSSGFYLFRIHKETRKAQLAYHCKKPFG